MIKNKAVKILIFFVAIIIFVVNISNAMSVDNLKGNFTDTSDVKTIGNKAVKIVSTIGSILSVIVIVILGIKYMLGSVEEKAEYKKSLMPYLIGAIIIFSASTIAGNIYKFAIQINKWYNIYSKA